MPAFHRVVCLIIAAVAVNALQHRQHFHAASSARMSRSSSSASKPHIIFVLLDDLGYGDMGRASGGQTYTPTFDRLAADGTILENYYVYPSCSPTRSAINTGRHAMKTGIYTPGKPNEPVGIPLHFKTLAEAMKENGYSTHMVGKWHVGSYTWKHTPTYRGFQSFYGFFGWQETYFEHIEVGRGLPWGVYDFHYQNSPNCGDGCHQVLWDESGNYSTEVFGWRAENIISRHDTETPLFLYLAEQAPHGPLACPDQYLSYKPQGSVRNDVLVGALAAADISFQAILDALAVKDMLENTIVIFSSDNGGEFDNDKKEAGPGHSNFPLRGAKHTLFEGGIRAANFVWSGSKAPQVRKGSFTGLMHAVDWFPTLLQMIGANYSVSEFDGVSQWDALSTGASAQDYVFLGYHHEDNQAGYAVRHQDWKLIVGFPGMQGHSGWINFDGQSMKASPEKYNSDSVLLYNISSDNREEHNLADDYPDVVAELKERAWSQLQNRVGSYPDYANCKDFDPSVGVLLPWC